MSARKSYLRTQSRVTAGWGDGRRLGMFWGTWLKCGLRPKEITDAQLMHVLGVSPFQLVPIVPLLPGDMCLYSAMTLTIFNHWYAQMQINQKTKAPAVLGRVLEAPVLDLGKAGGCYVERMSLRKGQGRKGRRRWIWSGRWMGSCDNERSPVWTYFPKCNTNFNIVCSHTRA